jgi:hypothetical protein
MFQVLADFYGTDSIHFTLTSDELPGVTRSFDSFSQAAAENARSRIYLGIHWNFDDTVGRELGEKVGAWVFDRVATAYGSLAAPAPIAGLFPPASAPISSNETPSSVVRHDTLSQAGLLL